MKKGLVILSLFVSLLALMACGKRDVEYFKAHPAEMKQKMEECKKMSAAEVLTDRECAAISQADSDRFFGDKIKTNPMEEPQKGRPTKGF